MALANSQASPIHFECIVRQIVDLGNGAGGGAVVIGEVVHVHVDERVLIGTDKINLEVLQPVGRLAGMGYVRVTVVIEVQRPPSQISPKE